MNAGKSVLARVASDLSNRLGLIRLWTRLHRELKDTRSDSLDRAFLAAKRGRLNEPPYASLRQ